MDVVGKRGWYFLLSALVLIPGVISLAIPPSINPGIDFSSGSAFEVTFGREVHEAEVRDGLGQVGHSNAKVQKLDSDLVFIRTKQLMEGEREEIEAALERTVHEIRAISKVETVSPEVAVETVRNALIAVLAAAVGILVYITWAFRNVPSAFRYGFSALLALGHDLLLIVGIFSILGKVIDLEVNAMFIVGLLAVAGYSVNDTIVVFDRIRENVARNIDRPLDESVNLSIMESMGRSLGTSLTTFIAILALILIGGSTLREFLLVLIIGVISGTYSSIFIASQFLVMWERGEIRRSLRFVKLRRPRVRSS